ncbi:serine hydroxymethyltransferase [Candidatus Woesearchaeota archaeon]|nr:serine hydroxymethyltransferase [Candidatus Woesearchaeota archaeon]
MRGLAEADPRLHDGIVRELSRQRQGIELIPSENFVSKAVLQAMGSVLTNKYSEGYPRRRYYGGNEVIDELEQLAIDRAKQLFGADHANVQPHAGSQANMEAYFALLELGDPILGMDLAAGGHLTHGSPVNFSGRFYHFSSYGVDPKTHLLDMDAVRKRALADKPKLLLSGFSAYPRKLDFKAFGDIAAEAGAYHMSDIAHIAGLVATKAHQSPVPYADVVTTTTHKTLRGPRGAIILCREEHRKAIDKAVFPGMQGGPLEHVIAAKAAAFGEALKPDFAQYQRRILANAQALATSLLENGISLVTGGTDNHLMVIDLTPLGIGGKEAEKALDSAGIYTNKNMIPFDTRSPFDPSGIRIGTPAITTRGFSTVDCAEVGAMIARVLKRPQDASVIAKVKGQVGALCASRPLYEGLGILG